MVDPFKVLGVSNTSSEEDIKKAYLELVKQYHPDRNPSPTAAEKFKQISTCYDLIKTSDLRRQWNYDQSLNDNTSYDNTWDTNVNQTSGWAHRNNDGRGDTGSARMKGKHFRGLMAFERFIHPYTLMAVGAVGGLVYLGMSTFKKKDRIVNNGVNAWYNDKSGRWETPQPWNEDFRKFTANGNALQMVERKLVHDVDKK